MPSLAKKRSDGQKQLDALFSDPKRVLLVHYACEDFANRPDGTSARVTSIAVRHLDNALTHSYSVHLSAERLGVPYSEIPKKYTELEKHMLSEFNELVQRNLSCVWVHWAMRDSNYGFPAIYHRCRFLGIEPEEIPPNNLFDLARALVSIYGMQYMQHPRLPSLLKHNGISDLGYLDGLSEVEAFTKGDYVALHRSTLRKVDCFESILTRAHARTLETNYRWRDIYGKSLKDIVFFLKEHWVYTLIGIIMSAYGIFKVAAAFFGTRSD